MRCDNQNQFVIAGFVYTHFTAGLLNVVRYNKVFVIEGFVIAGCHCIEVFTHLTSGHENSLRQKEMVTQKRVQLS